MQQGVTWCATFLGIKQFSMSIPEKRMNLYCIVTCSLISRYLSGIPELTLSLPGKIPVLIRRNHTHFLMWGSHTIVGWKSSWCSTQASARVNNMLLKCTVLLQSIPNCNLQHFLDNLRLFSWHCHSNYSFIFKISSNDIFQVHMDPLQFII